MKYKTCVYAICKNEEKFVDRWYESIKDSDYICVLDTGSSDNTVKKLKSLGITVKVKNYDFFRFDEARNDSMKMIPKDTDICICLDLDEVMVNGWKDELNKIWNKSVTRVKYIYNWKLDKNNKALVTFFSNKIHSLNYKWIYPVHEILKCNKSEKEIVSNNIVINHYPDSGKSRKQYLKLLELSVKESNDSRNLHYLGREYMYHKKWNKCIDTLIKYLSISTWKDERSASMRFISRCYIALNRYNEAMMWLDKSIIEAPYLREGYVEKMFLEYDLKNYSLAIYNGLKALEIKTHELTYMNEIFAWDDTVDNLLKECYKKSNLSIT